MVKPQLTRVSDPETQRALDELVTQIGDQYNTFPPFGYVVEDVLLTTVEVGVVHRLGKKPSGWVVIDRDANQHIYRSSKSTEQRLFLTASGSVVASIWIF